MWVDNAADSTAVYVLSFYEAGRAINQVKEPTKPKDHPHGPSSNMLSQKTVPVYFNNRSVCHTEGQGMREELTCITTTRSVTSGSFCRHKFGDT